MENEKMIKVAMSKVTMSDLLALVSTTVSVPKNIIVVDYSLGTIRNVGDRPNTEWAKLMVTDSDKLKALKSIGLAENAELLPLKMRAYDGSENELKELLGKSCAVDLNFELIAIEGGMKKGLNFEGLGFRVEYNLLKSILK